MSTPTGGEYDAAQARDFETCFLALDYMDEHGIDEIDLGDFNDDDLPQADLKVALGLELFDPPIITRDEVEERLGDHLAADKDVIYRLTLSFGGLNAHVEVRTYRGLIQKMTYHYGWGSESYERELRSDEPMGRWAEREAKGLMEAEY